MKKIRPSSSGFTLIELLVVIAVIAILAAILLPALAAAKEKGRRAACTSNVRQICVAIINYAGDNNDFMPPLKFRGEVSSGGNLQYPYEMFRYNPPAKPPPYDSAGGPYNLGILWSSGILIDGKVFYCPSDMNSDSTSYDYYTVNPANPNWPWGSDPADSNYGYVRAGYSYYPQSKNMHMVNTAGEGKQNVPYWPNYANSPEPLKTWICVPPFKQTDINQNKSMVVDTFYDTISALSHKTGGIPSGINAGFGDGHVNWQGVRVVTDGFDPNYWLAMAHTTEDSFDYEMVMSCWRP